MVYKNNAIHLQCHKAQNYLNVKIMKNLSKELLINALEKERMILKEINSRIEKRKLTKRGHSLYQWKYMCMGEINMLENLIKTIEESTEE